MSDFSGLVSAFPLDGWGVDPVWCRAFTLDDASAYFDLSVGDPTFHWDREEKPREFADFMMQFRLDHYERFGFGIMACTFESELVGQAGVQVVPEHPQDVELAVFLGRAFRGRGWGRLLNEELLRRCWSAGLEKVYATVREENTAARELMIKLGGQITASGIHYGQQATEFSFLLGGDTRAGMQRDRG